MANIRLDSVSQQLKSDFKTEGPGGRWEIDCLAAARRACGKINTLADLETKITLPTKLEQEITLDQNYEWVFVEVMRAELSYIGRESKGKAKYSKKDIETNLHNHIDLIRQGIMNDAMDDDTTYEDDFFGLGATS